jgi:hypothetical protein
VYNVSISDLKKMQNIAVKYGFPVEWLANLINHESAGTFNPEITNSIGATGLIQFMPNTAQGLGTTTDKLRKMTFAQQLDFVDQYLYNTFKNKKLLDENGRVKSTMNQGDLFMSIFYPAAVGNPNYIFPSNVQSANSVSTPKEYTEKALKNAVFSLDVAPFSLAEYLEKYKVVSPSFTKSGKRWWILPIGIFIFGSALIYGYWYIKHKKIIR